LGVIVLSILGVTITAAIANSATRDFRQNINFYEKYYLITIPSTVGSEEIISDINSQLDRSEAVEITTFKAILPIFSQMLW
jgi:hypothetical protein